MDDELKKALKDGLMILAIAIAGYMVAFHLTSCHSLKTVKHEIRDSVAISYHDSTIYRTEITTKDSIVIKDSVIGIAGQNAGFSIAHGSTSDTTIKKGKIRITRTVNNGIETINCDTDSLTIAIEDLRIIVHREKIENDSLSKVIASTDKTHSEVTIKEKQQGWFGRVLNYFLWLGWVLFIGYFIKKKMFG